MGFPFEALTIRAVEAISRPRYRNTMSQRDQTKFATPGQIRAARALVGLSQSEVAGRAQLSIPTVKRAESDIGLRASVAAVAAIRATLEAAGVEFTHGNGAGVGVRLRR